MQGNQVPIVYHPGVLHMLMSSVLRHGWDDWNDWTLYRLRQSFELRSCERGLVVVAFYVERS